MLGKAWVMVVVVALYELCDDKVYADDVDDKFCKASKSCAKREPSSLYPDWVKCTPSLEALP